MHSTPPNNQPLELNDTVKAYLNEAALFLTRNIQFSNQEQFATWLNNNFRAVVDKAIALQAATVEAMLSKHRPETQLVMQTISHNVYTRLRG